MRQIFKRVGKSTLSIILCVMMVFSTMLIGTVTTASAASCTSGQVIYFVPNDGWKADSARFAMWVWNNDTDGKWYSMMDVYNDGTTYYAVMGGSYANVIFCRMNPANSTNSWDNRWNQTGNLTFDSGNNCWSITGGSTGSPTGSWGKHQPTATASLTASPSTDVKVGDSVSLTSKLTSYSFYNTIKSTTYPTVTLDGATATSGTDYTISGNTFVPKKAGTFVIKATVTYNANGFTSITKTVSPTTTLTVAVSEVSGIEVAAEYSDDGVTYTSGTNGGTVSIEATDNVGSTGTTVTATPADGYKFVGWSSSGTGTFADSASASTTYYPAEDNEVATAQFAKTYAVTYDTPSNATITVTNSKGTDLSETVAGDTVTVKVSPSANYKCTGITVSPSVTVSGDNGTYTFTMPASDVTVSANIVAKSQYTVTAKSSNTTYGSATASATAVYEGETVTLTASPASTSYVFKGWTLTGDYTTTGALTDSSLTITVNGDVTATATFAQDPGTKTSLYLIYGTSSNNPNTLTNSVSVYKLSNGEYIATLDSVDTSKNYYFALSDSTSYTGMYWQGDSYVNNVSVKSDDDNLVEASYQNYNLNNVKYNFGYLSFKDTTIDSLVIKVGDDDGNGNVKQPNYVVRPTSSVPDGAIKIWAKDGSTVDGGTNKYGETTITSGTLEGSTVADAGTYKTYYAPAEGGIITIRTQINTDSVDYISAGYYVYAYVINGKTVTTTKIGDGLYESTYSVPANYTGTIEITPVYFNTKIEEAGDYITFYADASEVSELWGNTVGCYGYYYYDTNKNAYSVEGVYPGQPMLLNANGKYFTKLARYYYNDKGEKTDYQISGITLNNFYEGDIHKSLLTGESAKNHQTYDYDDFKFLSDPALEYDTIEFDIKYRTSTSNQSTLNNGSTGAVDKDSITISTFTNQNGWDDFTDYDGNLVDIQGNEVTNMDNKIYIVSTGNQNTDIGKWSTVWYVYDANGTYITQGHPSDFIPRSDTTQNTTAYNAMTAYAGYYTQICFESLMVDGGNRVDGRWYYKNSTKSEVTVDVSVQYSDDNGVNWATDTTGTKGTATIDGQTTITYDQANIEATLNAVAGDGYMFYEWGMVDSNGENYKTLTKSVTDKIFVDTNYHLVARFVKVDDQSLVISHERYVGPDAVGGYGFYYASATLYHKDGTTEEFPQSESTFTVPLNYDLDSTLSITLTTTCSGANTFIAWYQYLDGNYEIIEPETDVYGKTGTVSYTFEMNVADLFKDQNTLVIQSLNYYSDIARVSVDAVLNYKYNNRFGEEKTYTKNVKLDDAYIAANGYTITDELIYANAPAIDDLYKDCKWTITEQTVSKNATTATLRATQEDKPYTVKFVETVDGEQVIKQTAVVALNDYIAVDGNGKIYGTKEDPADFKFYETAEKLGELSFAYWLVTDTETEKEVAKCYYHEFNLKIVGDYTIEAIYGEASTSIIISEPTYTREQFTDSEGKVVTDYVYADFIVSYMEDNGNGVLLNSASGANYRTGLVVEFDKDVKVNVDDVAGGTLSDEQKVTFSSDSDTIKDFVLSGEGSKVYDTDDADTVANRALYNFAINNSDYNNKNRLDFYVRYNNTASIRQYAMKAYYYVYQVDADGNVVEGSYKITEPVYFYFYEIGNSTSNTAELVVTE